MENIKDNRTTSERLHDNFRTALFLGAAATAAASYVYHVVKFGISADILPNLTDIFPGNHSQYPYYDPTQVHGS